MAFRKAFILGGAVVLAAACSSGSTAPVIRANGGAARADATADSNATKGRPGTTTWTTTASDSTCRGNYSVQSGRSDSTCGNQ